MTKKNWAGPTEDRRWAPTIKSNQPVASASDYKTIATTTTSGEVGAVEGVFVLIASAGADHFVSFDGPATTTSAVVPAGQVMMFEIDDIEDGTVVSARATSGNGYITIYQDVY